jgi:drug/metabolite transporter (DMT)-like permease
MSSSSLLIRLAPVLFVLIWSTGWISAKYAAPHADPLWFLVLRFTSAGLVIAAYAFFVRAPWPATASAWRHAIVAGMLLHGVYLGGVWWAVKQGLPAGLSGLLAAIQPLVTAVLAPMILSERLTARQWLGFGAGLVGVLLVLSPKLTPATFSAEALGWPLIINVIGVLSLTAGSFYQKRFVASGDLRTVTATQYIGALLVVAPLAFLLEARRFDINIHSIAVLAWSVLVLSVFAIALMLMMINRGQVSRVSALNYLVPSTVAVQAFLMFGETLDGVQVSGMILTAVGVYLTTAAPKSS